MYRPTIDKSKYNSIIEYIVVSFYFASADRIVAIEDATVLREDFVAAGKASQARPFC